MMDSIIGICFCFGGVFVIVEGTLVGSMVDIVVSIIVVEEGG